MRRLPLILFLLLSLPAFGATKYEKLLAQKKSGSRDLQALTGATTYVYQPGATASTSDVGTTVTVFSSSNIRVGDIVEANGMMATVLSVPTSTTFTINTSFSWSAGTRFLRTNAKVPIYYDATETAPITQPHSALDNGTLIFYVDALLYPRVDIKATSGSLKLVLADEIPITAWEESNVATVFNVKTYGATGDCTSNNLFWGDCTDDTAAIQAAIDAAEVYKQAGQQQCGGGTVYFPPGEYYVTDNLRVKKNVSLVGTPVASRLTSNKPIWIVEYVSAPTVTGTCDDDPTVRCAEDLDCSTGACSTSSAVADCGSPSTIVEGLDIRGGNKALIGLYVGIVNRISVRHVTAGYTAPERGMGIVFDGTENSMIETSAGWHSDFGIVLANGANNILVKRSQVAEATTAHIAITHDPLLPAYLVRKAETEKNRSVHLLHNIVEKPRGKGASTDDIFMCSTTAVKCIEDADCPDGESCDTGGTQIFETDYLFADQALRLKIEHLVLGGNFSPNANSGIHLSGPDVVAAVLDRVVSFSAQSGGGHPIVKIAGATGTNIRDMMILANCDGWLDTDQLVYISNTRQYEDTIPRDCCLGRYMEFNGQTDVVHCENSFGDDEDAEKPPSVTRTIRGTSSFESSPSGPAGARLWINNPNSAQNTTQTSSLYLSNRGHSGILIDAIKQVTGDTDPDGGDQATVLEIKARRTGGSFATLFSNATSGVPRLPQVEARIGRDNNGEDVKLCQDRSSDNNRCIVWNDTESAVEFSYSGATDPTNPKIDLANKTVNANTLIAVDANGRDQHNRFVLMDNDQARVPGGSFTTPPVCSNQNIATMTALDTDSGDTMGYAFCVEQNDPLLLQKSMATINHLLKIQPITDAPACAELGLFYVDDSGAACFCNGAAWENLASGGSCS